MYDAAVGMNFVLLLNNIISYNIGIYNVYYVKYFIIHTYIETIMIRCCAVFNNNYCNDVDDCSMLNNEHHILEI